MTRLHGLTIDEAASLILMSQGRRQKSLSLLGMSDAILDALLDRGAIVLNNGIVEITDNGLAEADRLTAPTADEPLPATLRARARAMGSRITPIPPSRTPP